MSSQLLLYLLRTSSHNMQRLPRVVAGLQTQPSRTFLTVLPPVASRDGNTAAFRPQLLPASTLSLPFQPHRRLSATPPSPASPEAAASKATPPKQGSAGQAQEGSGLGLVLATFTGTSLAVWAGYVLYTWEQGGPWGLWGPHLLSGGTAAGPPAPKDSGDNGGAGASQLDAGASEKAAAEEEVGGKEEVTPPSVVTAEVIAPTSPVLAAEVVVTPAPEVTVTPAPEVTPAAEAPAAVLTVEVEAAAPVATPKVDAPAPVATPAAEAPAPVVIAEGAIPEAPTPEPKRESLPASKPSGTVKGGAKTAANGDSGKKELENGKKAPTPPPPPPSKPPAPVKPWDYGAPAKEPWQGSIWRWGSKKKAEKGDAPAPAAVSTQQEAQTPPPVERPSEAEQAVVVAVLLEPPADAGLGAFVLRQELPEVVENEPLDDEEGGKELHPADNEHATTSSSNALTVAALLKSAEEAAAARLQKARAAEELLRADGAEKGEAEQDEQAFGGLAEAGPSSGSGTGIPDSLQGAEASTFARLLVETANQSREAQAESDARAFEELLQAEATSFQQQLKEARAEALRHAQMVEVLEKELSAKEAEHRRALEQQLKRGEERRVAALRKKAEEAAVALEDARELSRAALAAAVAKERALALQDLDALRLQVESLRTAFDGRSEHARKSYGAHKLAMGAFALEQAMRAGQSLSREGELLRAAASGSGGAVDPVVEAALSTLPARVLERGGATLAVLEEKFYDLRAEARELALLPEGGGGVLAHALAKLITLLKASERGTELPGGGADAALGRAESLLARGDMAGAAKEVQEGLRGTAGAAAAERWVQQVRERAIAEQALALILAHAVAQTAGLR